MKTEQTNNTNEQRRGLTGAIVKFARSGYFLAAVFLLGVVAMAQERLLPGLVSNRAERARARSVSATPELPMVIPNPDEPDLPFTYPLSPTWNIGVNPRDYATPERMIAIRDEERLFVEPDLSVQNPVVDPILYPGPEKMFDLAQASVLTADSLKADGGGMYQMDSGGTPATMSSPTNNSTLSNSLFSFSWSAGSGVSQYALWFGTTSGVYDLYAINVDTNLTYPAVVPMNAQSLYVRLWSLISGDWQGIDYTYSRTNLGPVAYMATPANYSAVTNTSATFNWTAGTNVSAYALWIGTTNTAYSTNNAYDVYAASTGTNLSHTATNLPPDGRQVYLKLWSELGSNWRYTDYTYTAVDWRALMISPTNNTVFTNASVSFSWSAGTNVSQYALWVGSTVDAYDLHAVNYGTNRAATVTLPTDRRPLYVRLWSLIGGNWNYKSYTYTAMDGTARMLSPTPGTTLTGTNVTFTWNSGTGVVAYALWAGSTLGTWDICATNVGTSLSHLVALPADGRTIYWRLWSKIDTNWFYNDYTYTAVTATKAAMTSPTPGSTLPGSSATFLWNAGTFVTNYGLWVGTTQGGSNLYNWSGTSLSQTVTNLPTNGSNIYVRLRSDIGFTNAPNWLYNDYTYTAWFQTTTNIYYVDFAGGNDSNTGTSPSSAWKHCPGDTNALGVPATMGGKLTSPMPPGTIVKFKGGVNYYGSIFMHSSGTTNAPVIYDGITAGWGSSTNKAIINGGNHRESSPNYGFYVDSDWGVENIEIRNFEIAYIGSVSNFSSLATNDFLNQYMFNCGIFLANTTNVVVTNCYFHEIGVWQNEKPAVANSQNGFGIWASGVTNLTVANCEFTKMERGVRVAPGQYANCKAALSVLITDCDFHSYMTWCIDLLPTGSGATLSNITVRNCKIHDFTEFDAGVWKGWPQTNDADVYGFVKTNDLNPHTDGIIMGSGNNDYSNLTLGTIRIHSNSFYQNATNGGGTAMVFLSGMGGNVLIYNNTFVNVRHGGGAILVQDGPKQNQNVTPLQNLGIYNNSLFDMQYGVYLRTNTVGCNLRVAATSIRILNNSFYKATGNDAALAVVVHDTSSVPTEVNYNFYFTYLTNQTIIDRLDLGVSWTIAQASNNNWETQGNVSTNPTTNVYVNITNGLGLTSSSNNLQLTNNSPCINAGINLYQVFTNDMRGTNRPSSGAWEIGAYEYP